MADNDNTLRALHDWVDPLLQALSTPERRKLARQMGAEVRRLQAQRMARQRDPDGTPYAPRKRAPLRIRRKQGEIRRQMFAKLRQASHLKVFPTQGGVEVGFAGRDSRIARPHQEGLLDNVYPKIGPRVRYPQRILLGWSPEDQALVRDIVLKHLERAAL